jgi:hypothetical protein
LSDSEVAFWLPKHLHVFKDDFCFFLIFFLYATTVTSILIPKAEIIAMDGNSGSVGEGLALKLGVDLGVGFWLG